MDNDKTILIVDDDLVICNILSRYLTSSGYRVKTAANAEDMRRSVKIHSPDLVILDLQLPGTHGLELTRELRNNSDLGIIILTGSDEEADKIVGLEGGADDYITKPCDERELLARVRTLLRRVRNTTQTAMNDDKSVVKFADLTLDLTAHELKATNGEEIHLTSYEFQILATLAKHPNQVLSRNQLMENITGRDWVADGRNVDVLIGKLRKKIEKEPHNPSMIKTIRGIGYKFTIRAEYL